MVSTRVSLAAALGMMVMGTACRNRSAAAADTVGAAQAARALSPERLASAGGDTALDRRADLARIQGSPNAPVWVVEVSDFQCPFCKDWHDQTYPTVEKAYVDSGKVRLAYVNFPLPIHKNAWPAAEAAMCAAAQDHFWPMHDALFATQDAWGESDNPRPTFDSLAAHAGVNAATFDGCLDQHQMRALIQADIARATAAGVQSTPTFLIGGSVVRGAQPTDVFQQAIDAALTRAHAATKKP